VNGEDAASAGLIDCRASASGVLSMNRWLTALLACAALAAAGAAYGQGDVAAGKQKAGACAACHGADGNSSNPQWPKLAGLGEQYIVRQLKAFKSGERQSPMMTPQAQPLNEQDMQDLAAYFSSLTMQPGAADPKLAKVGEQIYRGGIPAKGVPACAACHSPTGAGNPAAGYPRIGGQHAVYLANELSAYRAGQRTTDPAGVMRDIASGLSDDEIRAVASYASGLYRRKESAE
jgi:cytochrome c553